MRWGHLLELANHAEPDAERAAPHRLVRSAALGGIGPAVVNLDSANIQWS
jgi:hypothetical protein